MAIGLQTYETPKEREARLAREREARLQTSTSGPAVTGPADEVPDPVYPPDQPGTVGPPDADPIVDPVVDDPPDGPIDPNDPHGIYDDPANGPDELPPAVTNDPYDGGNDPLYDQAGWQGATDFVDLPISDIDYEYMNPQVQAALEKLLAQGVRGTDAEEAAAQKDIERGLGSSLASTRARGGFGGQFISGAASAQEGDIRSRAADEMIKARLGIQKGARDEWARDLGMATSAFDAASGRTLDAAGLKLDGEKHASDNAFDAWNNSQDRSLTAFDNLQDRGLSAADLGITQKAFDAILKMLEEQGGDNNDEDPAGGGDNPADPVTLGTDDPITGTAVVDPPNPIFTFQQQRQPAPPPPDDDDETAPRTRRPGGRGGR